jgi:hypothetical protein
MSVPANAESQARPDEGAIVAATANGIGSKMKARFLKKGLVIGVLSMYDSQGQAHIDDINGCPYVVDARTVRLATDLERLNAGFDEPDF